MGGSIDALLDIDRNFGMQINPLLEDKQGFTALQYAILSPSLSNRIEIFETLLRDHANYPGLLKHQDRSGRTLVHHLVQMKDLAALSVLVKYQAPLDDAGAFGTTPLFMAIDQKSPELIELLLNNRANPNAFAQGWITPLHYAASKNDVLSIKLLLAKGANKNLITFEGETAYQVAIRANAKEAAALLK